jgi:serine protease Do
MKKILLLFLAGTLGGVAAISAYKVAFEDQKTVIIESPANESQATPRYTSTAILPNNSTDFTLAAEKTVNAVVHVKTQLTLAPMQNPWFELFGYEGESQVQQGSGSGVIISPNGYIVTNNHVIDGAQEISVSMNNNKTYTAKVIGTDPATDIALLKIESTNLPTVSFGDSDALKVGEWVLAVGNPFDLTSTVTAGIVSAKARNINLLQVDPNRDVFPIESFIQTDAAVNPGNSGGALVNANGQLVGINTAIASRTGSYSGYSFAVPVTIVEKVTKDLMEYGTVQRAFIGVSINDVTEDLAKQIGLADVSGVYVNDLLEAGAAADAGIEAGDVITKVGTHAVKNVPELQEQISRYRPGDTVDIGIWRDGKNKDVNLILRNKEGSLEMKTAEAKEIPVLLGADLTTVSEEELTALKIPGGAKVAKLRSGKLSSTGVKTGFIITKVDGTKVYNPDDLERILKSKSGGVLIEGIYPNGQKAYYGFGM